MMKKVLLFSLCALMIFSAVGIVSAADTPGWVIPKGFTIGDSPDLTPVTASVDENNVLHLSHGGYYVDGTYWGGAVSDKKYKLDGLKVEVEFSAVSEKEDRWIGINFLEKQSIFKVKDIPSNRGYACLIRPKTKEDNSSLSWEQIEALDKFAITSSQPIQAEYKAGLKLTMEIKKDGDNYAFYLNGVQSKVAFLNFKDIFKDGEAYIVIAASGKLADKDAYKYTVKVSTGNTNIPSVTPAVPTSPVITDKPAEPATPTQPAKPAEPVKPNPNPNGYKVGDVINHVLNTDIVAYINGKPIKSYNIDGNTAVLAEDLMNYGFNVVWNGAARTLSVDKGSGTITSTYVPVANPNPVGSLAFDVLYTDIITYVNGVKVSGYNVNGSTIIYIDDLTPFGALKWDAAARSISFTSK